MRMQLLNSAAQVLLATDAAAAQPAESAAPKAKTVSDDMPQRRIFANTEEATAYLVKCGEDYSDFGDVPLASVGIGEDGSFDPEVYTPLMRIMVAKVNKAKEGAKCIVIAPVPTYDSLYADDTGTAWVQKLIDKELNHVAVRALRIADDISTVQDQIPATRDAYLSSTREGGTGIMATFDALYKVINVNMGKKVPAWARYRLTKNDLKKALESKGYAEEFYAGLENRGEGKPSLFAIAAQAGSAAAKKQGLDPAIFDKWLATRDAKKYDAAEDTDDFDLDGLADSLKADEPDAADATA